MKKNTKKNTKGHKHSTKEREEYRVSIIGYEDTFSIDAPEWMDAELIHLILQDADEAIKGEMIEDKLAAEIEKSVQDHIAANKKAEKAKSKSKQ